MNSAHDIIVVGGGMVGSAIAWGLTRLGIKVLVLDGEDESQRAARANFGLIWGQSKGDTLPQYALWTREALALWEEFQDELLNITGVSCGYHDRGGLHLCMTEQELEDRRALYGRMNKIDGDHPLDLKILDQKEAAELMPGLGTAVVGAGYCAQDSHASPHGLLMAMQRAIVMHGSTILSKHQVSDIRHGNGKWQVQVGQDVFETPSLVLAAGTGNKALGDMIDFNIPVFGLKGQILVTERLKPRFNMPSHKVRQTDVGTMLLGDSKEPEAKYDDRSSDEAIRDIAQRCIKMFPFLSEINLVRAWGGIRTMTEDSFPIYDYFPQHPGLFAANCHSGVTLAPVHALRLAPIIAKSEMTDQIAAMSSRRFDVQAH